MNWSNVTALEFIGLSKSEKKRIPAGYKEKSPSLDILFTEEESQVKQRGEWLHMKRRYEGRTPINEGRAYQAIKRKCFIDVCGLEVIVAVVCGATTCNTHTYNTETIPTEVY